MFEFSNDNFQNQIDKEDIIDNLSSFSKKYNNLNLFIDNKLYSFWPKIEEDIIIPINNNDDLNHSEKKNIEESKFNEKTDFIPKIMPLFYVKREKRNLGRKRKNDEIKGKHDKFSNDNLTRKLKTKLFSAILNLLNSSFAPCTIVNNKSYLNKKENYFLKIKQEIIININAINNLTLLKSKLKDIFSNEVSKKIASFGLNYNLNLINKIYKENKQKKIISILERTLFECLEQFRGTKYYEELKGLENGYKKAINEFKRKGESDKYILMFDNFAKNFENYYFKKKVKKWEYN